MGNINLNWDNSAVVANPNATEQNAKKRKKSVGGPYDQIGFTPANPMATSVNAAVSAVTDNIIYEYLVDAICAVGGPIPNINGIQEGINFACFNPSLTSDNGSVSVSLNVTGLDITKARFYLYKASDDSLVGGPTVANRIGTTISTSFTGLLPSTNYYLKYEMYATVNAVEVVSSDVAYLNALCGGNIAGFTIPTVANPTCPAPAALVVTPA